MQHEKASDKPDMKRILATVQQLHPVPSFTEQLSKTNVLLEKLQQYWMVPWSGLKLLSLLDRWSLKEPALDQNSSGVDLLLNMFVTSLMKSCLNTKEPQMSYHKWQQHNRNGIF